MKLILSIPIIEVLILNLISTDRCLKKRYSGRRTALVLALFSAAIFTILFFALDDINNRPNGQYMLVGFAFLPVLYVLYEARMIICIITMCTCWVYTLGVFSVAFLCASLWFAGEAICGLIIETVIFLISFRLFTRYILSRFIFVVENIEAVDKSLNKFIFLNSSLNFFVLALTQRFFLDGAGSYLKLALLLMFLCSIFIMDFIMYRIVYDSIRASRLERAVFTDSLTGIGNRTGLQKRLQEYLEKGEAFSAVFMDLDKFKSVNDHYGHLIGDAYLKHFAKLSMETVMPGGGAVYRFGGDEFVALYGGKIPEQLVDELRECRRWDIGAPCPFYQVSVGVLYCDKPHEENAESILRAVDQMMYKNKAEKQQNRLQNPE